MSKAIIARMAICIRTATWLALGACSTPAILEPKTHPDLTYPHPCADAPPPVDPSPHGAFREFVESAPSAELEARNMCCPAGFVLGGIVGSSCSSWLCCPIWEGMGEPPT